MAGFNGHWAGTNEAAVGHVHAPGGYTAFRCDSKRNMLNPPGSGGQAGCPAGEGLQQLHPGVRRPAICYEF